MVSVVPAACGLLPRLHTAGLGLLEEGQRRLAPGLGGDAGPPPQLGPPLGHSAAGQERPPDLPTSVLTCQVLTW